MEEYNPQRLFNQIAIPVSLTKLNLEDFIASLKICYQIFKDKTVTTDLQNFLGLF